MVSNNYDVIVVGSGLGGLGTGAILAVKERKRVLVLEKESFKISCIASTASGDNVL